MIDVLLKLSGIVVYHQLIFKNPVVLQPGGGIAVTGGWGKENGTDVGEI